MGRAALSSIQSQSALYNGVNIDARLCGNYVDLFEQF